MSSGLNNINEAQLPVPRSVAPYDPAAGAERRNYKILSVNPYRNSVAFPTDEATRTSRISDIFKVSGDHITIMEVAGQEFFGISINRGQYIPIREGMVIRREITEFRIRAFGFIAPNGYVFNNAFIPYPAEIILAISYGPFIEYGVREHGFQAGCPKFRGTATTTGVTLFGGADAPFTADVPQQVLKWGGTMMIRNRSQTTSLLLYDGQGGDFGSGGGIAATWEILPGEVLTMDAKCRLSTRQAGFFIGSGFAGLNVCLACAAGTCPYNVMLSSWGDASDLDAKAAVYQSLEYGERG